MAPVGRAHPATSVCGTVASVALAEPPNVDVWKQPLDANGLHAIVLAVNNDKQGALLLPLSRERHRADESANAARSRGRTLRDTYRQRHLVAE